MALYNTCTLLRRLPAISVVKNALSTSQHCLEGQRFEGRVAIVTGGTKGMGFASARRMAQDGCSVMICSRRSDNVEKAVKELRDEGLRVLGLPCNVGKQEDREKLVEKTLESFGAIDYLINIAGVNPVTSANNIDTLSFTSDQWNKLFEVNVKAPFALTKLVAPEIKKRGKGAIVNMTSIAGVHPWTFLGPYGVSKAALNMLTKVLASDLGDHNIRVNAIVPGHIKTEFIALQTPEMIEVTNKFYNYDSHGAPEDISGVVAFLCSEDARFINGDIVFATGGCSPACRLPRKKEVQFEE